MRQVPHSQPTIEKISELLTQSSVFVLSLGFIITVATGQKIHYIYFSLVCLILLLLNTRPYFNWIKLIIIFPLLVSFCFNFSANFPNSYFIISILPYFLIPIIFYSPSFSNFNLKSIMIIFDFFTCLNFVGLLFQLSGFLSPYLNVGNVITNDVTNDRYGSFAGGTLSLGVTASTSALYSFYNIIYDRKNTVFAWLKLGIAIFTMILAQSRRFYLVTFILMVLIYFLDVNKDFNYKKFVQLFIKTVLFLVVIFCLFFFFFDNSLFFNRLISTFDFQNDAANLERVMKWVFAINAFLSNFWMGMGIGIASTIGKNYDETVSVYDMFVAESYFLKIFVECGIFNGVIFLCLIFWLVSKSLKGLRNRTTALASVYILFYFFDSFFSTSLEAPLSAFIFWICASIVSLRNEEL